MFRKTATSFFQAIKIFVAKCLNLATEYGMTSIAFPALGTGNLGYPHKSVATAMFETVWSFMEGSVYTSVEEVVFNVFDEKSQEVILGGLRTVVAVLFE